MLMNYLSQLSFVYNIDKSYLLNQWVEFFVNKYLKLNNITINFRTNNAIDNYNHRFK